MLDPLNGRRLIEETVVAGCVVNRFGRKLRMREEAKNAEPIIHRHDYDVFVGEELPVLARFGGAAAANPPP